MNLSKLSRLKLLETCRKLNLYCQSKDSKSTLIQLLLPHIDSLNFDDMGIGKFYTISPELQDYVYQLVKYKGSHLLEPSFGAGHLLIKFLDLDVNYPMTCYEIDKNSKPMVNFNQYQKIIYGDFTHIDLETSPKFKTIIGNPPYAKYGTSNLYIKFIEMAFKLLQPRGELIFIVPSEFLKLTSSSYIISQMGKHGSFTHFYFPHDETLFDSANVDVVLFRYERDLHINTATVDNKGHISNKICNIKNGIITFTVKVGEGGFLLGGIFNIYVGMVSGNDKIYKVPFGNIDLLINRNRTERFIFPESYPTGNNEIDQYLYDQKDILYQRKIKKFDEYNWYKWGAPRSLSAIRENMGRDCVYVRNIARKGDIAFRGTVQYFGGALICLLPKGNISNNILDNVINYLNSKEVRQNYSYSGRFKIGHRLLTNLYIPIYKQ